MKAAAVDVLVEKQGMLAKWRLDGMGEGYVPARGFKYNGHMMEVLDGCNFLFNVKHGKPGRGDKSRRFRDGRGGTHKSFAHALHTIMDLKSEGIDVETFYRWSYLAVLAHDLGKAGCEFQRMLWTMEFHLQKTLADMRGEKLSRRAEDFKTSNVKELDPAVSKEVWRKLKKTERHTQAYRHEFLSALLMYHHDDIREWFRREAGSNEGFAYVLAGAFGHHLKAHKGRAFKDSDFWEDYEPGKVYLEQLSKKLRILTRSKALEFRCLPFPALTDWDKHPMLSTYEDISEAYTDIGCDPLFESVVDDRVSGAIKWMVILSDTLGSISQKKYPNGGWEKLPETRRRIYKALEDVFQPGKINYYQRIAGRLLEAATDEDWATIASFGEDELREFTEDSLRALQEEAAQVGGNLITCASTGGGKSIAALIWASLHPHQRLIFTTPTTDTATRIFMDYANKLYDFLRHSRSDMDRPDFKISLRSTPEDNEAEDGEEEDDAVILTETFAAFEQDVTFTTADQVLGILAFYRKSVMWLPYILSSQIVFDEFHAYDSTMWGWYMRFLEWFPGLRTAHMSATVPDYLRKELEKRVLTTEVGKAIRDPRGQGEASCIPRYRVRVVTESQARSNFDPGTLWITNTVARCQRLGLDFPDALAYHSRFKYIDRNGRRKGVIKGKGAVEGIRDRLVHHFRRGSTDLVRAVATQVAEMSLDISALQLITECCPPTAFIQRCGRTNRYLHPTELAEVLVYLPDGMENGLPYDRTGDWKTVYGKWMSFYKSLEKDYPRGISQAEMEKRLQEFYNDPENQEDPRTTHTQLYRTFRRNLRHGSVTTPVILRSVLDAFQKKHGRKMTKKEVRWLATPAVLNRTQRKELRAKKNLHDYHYILDDSDPTIIYDDRLGLLDMKKL